MQIIKDGLLSWNLK